MEELGNQHAVADRTPEEAGEGEAPVRPPLARLLREEGLTTPEHIERALMEGERTGERLGEVLLRWQLVDERQLALLLARQWQLPFLDEHELAPQRAVAILPLEDARQIGAVPVRWEDGTLRVAVAEPTEERLTEARARIPGEMTFGVVTHGTFTQLLTDGQPPMDQAPSGERRGFDELLGSLDEETAQLSRLRERVQQFAAFIAERDQTAARLEAQLLERDQTTARLEAELVAAHAEREQDRGTINHLEAELQERDGLLTLVDAKVNELVSALGARRGG